MSTLAVTGPAIAANPPPPKTPAETPAPLVVGGRTATQPYPWMASIQHPAGTHRCGGTLIRPDWILTAAHCQSILIPGQTTVRVGSASRTEGGTVASVTRVVLYPKYDPESPGDDLALLHLDRPSGQPVLLAPVPLTRVGDAVRVIGWGRTCEQLGCGAAPSLQEADVRRVADARCEPEWFDARKELCVEGDRGQGACHGDSGGPLLKRLYGRWVQVGVVVGDGDYTAKPGCANGTSVYTDVSRYRGWISRVIAARP